MTSEIIDVVASVEAAYVTDTQDATWLNNMLASVSGWLDAEAGLIGWFYDARNFSEIRLFHPTALNTREGALQAVFATASHEDMTADVLRHHYAMPASVSSEPLGADYSSYAPMVTHLFPAGIRDIVTINGMDVDGRGCAINALRSQQAHVTQGFRDTLERVAAHLTSAYRLRRRRHGTLEDRDGVPACHAGPEAWLTPDGAVSEANGEAKPKARREALRDAVRAMERSRASRNRAEPESALAAWKALVDSRWSLVDFFDSDGKRFLVAEINEPPVTASPLLSGRERQVALLAARGHSNKYIAYELGLAISTVAAEIARVIDKLGLRTRTDLARVFYSHEQA